MNRFAKTLCFLSAAGLIACSNASVPDAPQRDSKDLSQQLEGLKSDIVIDVDNLQGNTETEKLLYLLDIPTLLKSTTLIFLDTQIESFEAAGNNTQAKALKANRTLLTQAIDDTIEEYVKATATVYAEFFTPEEIKQLTVIYSQPVLQKFTGSTLDIQQKLIPISERWGTQHLAPRFDELIKEQAK